MFSPKFYIKEVPFLVNYKAIYRVRTAGHFLGLIILTAAITFTIINNLTPFDITVQYAMEKEYQSISQLGPKDRVDFDIVNGKKIFKQLGDYVYFTTDMPIHFDKATIRMVYKNPNPEQTISVGFQNGDMWSYLYKPFEVPFLNNTSLYMNGYEPVLYQKEQKYSSVESFLNNPPSKAVIGTFEYETSFANMASTSIPSYVPSKSETIIDTPLRGKHTLFVYMENEPFNMSIQKQDLNWYKNPDPMIVRIYKNNQLLYEDYLADDGIGDNSKKIMPVQELKIQNPSKKIPERGIYKVVIEATEDSIIKQIKTNLHKIIFANSIFPVTNSKAYPGIIEATKPTKVYTNALTLSAITNHTDGKQNILVGDQVLGVQTLNKSSYLPPKDDIAEVTIPQNDVVLNGFMGYFAFQKDQFFLPTKYYILPISKPEDISLVDYILTDYHPSYKDGEWQINDQTFDLKSAYIQDNKLSWIIKAPKLNERNGHFLIKDIQITFHKKGWL